MLVPLRIREAGREERTSPVLVDVKIEADTHAASRQQLMCFQLTDESDPFFLYSLRITEEEFQVILSSFVIANNDYCSKARDIALLYFFKYRLSSPNRASLSILLNSLQNS